MVVRVAKASKTHDHQLDEEEDEYGHKADALDPRVFCDWSREALIGKGFVGGCKKLQTVSIVAVVSSGIAGHIRV